MDEINDGFMDNSPGDPKVKNIIKRIGNLTKNQALEFIQNLEDEELKRGNVAESLEIIGLRVASKTTVIIAPV